jgi:hypothetical protein
MVKVVRKIVEVAAEVFREKGIIFQLIIPLARKKQSRAWLKGGI